MKKQGYRPQTIQRYSKIIKVLSQTANLLDGEDVKAELANKSWSEGTKELACDAYSLLAKSRGFSFERPRYERIEKLPFIPLEKELDDLIAGTGPKTSTILQLLKESAFRIGEAWSLKWTDLDFERSTITIAPEKRSRPRQCKISPKLLSALSRIPRNSPYIFGAGNVEKFRRNYEKQRNRLAIKLSNPRLNQTKLHSFRHWKATHEYHRTKDLLFVKELLGHKNIANTLRYTQLVDWTSDEYTCKTAKSLPEASSLIEAGFEYVTDLDGVRLFRKRK